MEHKWNTMSNIVVYPSNTIDVEALHTMFVTTLHQNQTRIASKKDQSNITTPIKDPQSNQRTIRSTRSLYVALVKLNHIKSPTQSLHGKKRNY